VYVFRPRRGQPGNAAAAAVAGRRFGNPLLERLVEPATLPAALSELLRLELIVEEQRRPYPAYRFRHGLVQEAAYASITESRRRALHARVGLALEQCCKRLAQDGVVIGDHDADLGLGGHSFSSRSKTGDAIR